MADVTTGQILLLCLAVALFAIGWAASLLRIRWESVEPLRLLSKASVYAGLLAGIGVLVWHSFARRSWLPLEDNFDALTWLGLLLGGFVAYVQATKPLRGLDWFLLPIAVLLLIAAAVFGVNKPHEYQVHNVWLWVHHVTAYGGAVAFAVAGAVGAMYLIVNRRLRSKALAPGPGMGSLERLEHLTLVSVTLGFSLLTIGVVTGMVQWFDGRGKHTPMAKVLLTAAVWLVYAVVLHSPINPSFRGRKAAVLSVVGLPLMLLTILVVQFV
jgi:ABC-type uncharacterized transport system permease subunit